MKGQRVLLAMVLLAVRASADEPPLVEHQPNVCTVPDKLLSLCARVSDDNQVAKARVYFRRAGDKHYSFVDMAFGGLNYCATLPAPRRKKVETIEYYVQAIDDDYQAQRTSTFRLQVQPEDACEFPPVEDNPEKTTKVVVYATHKKQKKLSDRFVSSGVRFVPLGTR